MFLCVFMACSFVLLSSFPVHIIICLVYTPATSHSHSIAFVGIYSRKQNTYPHKVHKCSKELDLGGDGMNGETGIDIYTLLIFCIK